MSFYSRKNAFTLVEIMIAVTIIGVILSIAVQNYLRISRVSAQNTCISNLKQIDGAVDLWATNNGIAEGVVPSGGQEEDIYGYIKGERPVCPSRGEYSIHAVGARPQVTCSMEESLGHKLP